MPELSDYEEINMTYLNVDHVTSRRSILSANYGDGYKDTTRVGAPGGVKTFTVSAGVWPDSEDQPMIGTQTIFDYYWSFFEERLDNANEPFVLEWRGRKWLVEFAEPEHGVEVHTADLFTPDGIELTMRRVVGLIHCLDGSVFDPSLIESSFWGRFRNAQNFPSALGFPWSNPWENEIDPLNYSLEAGSTDVTVVPNALGDHDAIRLSATTNDGFLYCPNASGPAPGIYEAFFVMKQREATFSNLAGILSADATVAGLVGSTGTPKFFDLGEGDDYEYKKNNVSYANSDMQAPMNEFGVVNVRFLNGKALNLLQIGKDRDFSGRFGKTDYLEIWLIKNAPLDELDSEAASRWLMREYDITA